MKCLKNEKTGNIIRVDDKQAEQMVGNTWKYISKSEWKLQTRVPKEKIVETVNDQITDSVTVSQKQLKRKKSK
jgi:hypothetical protein